MSKDQTIVGLTGKPVPKPKSAKKQYELEKKRSMQKHLGKNVGGVQYKSDVNPYYNPRARTFREFIEIAETVISEMPYQIYGPAPHGPSDSEPVKIGKPYKNKKRARTRADKLDQEIGGYRHSVRYVPEQ